MTARLVVATAPRPQVETPTGLSRLRPIYERAKYFEPLEREIYAYWYHAIYAPILEILSGRDRRENAKASLLQAIKRDRIQYRQGYFYGPFSSRVSKGLREIGATFDRNRKAFKLSMKDMPLDVREAIAIGLDAQREMIARVETRLARTTAIFEETQFNFEPLFMRVIEDANDQFYSTAKALITVPPSMSEEAANRLARAYSENLEPYIRDWSDKAVAKLREQVTVNVTQGFRSKELIEQIKADAGVAHRKAKFLARQETSLLLSRFRQERYADIGVTQYQWSTGNDERVRKDHALLHGQVFSYDNPPIVDRATGRRANPGEDYNCRCVAIPVFREVAHA